MDEFYIEKIIKNKIINNAYIDLVIHDLIEFEYNEKKYLNIYVLVNDKKTQIEINEKMPVNSIIINENVKCFCFLKDDVISNLSITGYIIGEKKYKVNSFVDVDYTDFISNANSLNIIRKLKLNGFKNIRVLPRTKEEYWICSCGKTNVSKNENCSNCGARLSFMKLYDNDEKIQRKYIAEMFKKRKFNSSNVIQELQDFRESILSDDKIIINKDYLTDKDLGDLVHGSSNKVDDFKYRIKNMKLVTKYIILAIIIITIVVIGTSISKTLSNNKDMEQLISQYCLDTSYKSVDNVLNEEKCGNIIYYFHNHKNLSESNILAMMDSGNEQLYKLYYKYFKENLHSTLGKNDQILSSKYIKYLVDSNASVSDDALSNSFANSLINFDKETFTNIAKIYGNSKERWAKENQYFNYGLKGMPVKDMLYKNTDYENVKNYVEYSMIYHTYSGDTDCNRADLYSVENIKYLISKRNSSVCSYEMTNATNYDVSLLKNYKAAGGNMKTSGYLGNMIYQLLWHSGFAEEEYANFSEALKILKNSGVNINEKMTSDQSDPGYTPLDRFIDKNERQCSDAKRGWSNSYGVKTCNTYKKYYKLLKKYGAVCNKQCSNEKYFK